MKVKVMFVLSVCLMLCHLAVAKDHVPVLIWNSNQAKQGIPSVSALQNIDSATLEAKYLETFKPNNILLFLQDALSIEDLTSHSSELQHIKNFMETAHSLYLPNVEDAHHIVHDLIATRGYNLVKLDHEAGLVLKQEDNNLVTVDLPSTLTNPSRRRAIQKADEVIDNVISKVGNARNFTVIFTGRKPSLDEESEQFTERIRIARSLHAIGDSPNRSPYHSSNCTKLYLRKDMTMRLYNGGSSAPDIFPISEEKALSEDTGDCQSDTQSLMIKYNNIKIADKSHAKFIVKLNFLLERGGSWVLGGAHVDSDTNSDDFDLINRMDSTPVGMSFACSKKFIFVNTDDFARKHGYSSAELVLENFQIQAFQKKHRFDGAYNCIGFFTVPIWCGLIVSFIFVTILSIGMGMISSIKTMDRFDDPKKQPVHVATAD